jgi:hypothetical protein
MDLSAQPGFAVEIHPPDWRFPASPAWIAGWIRPRAGQLITDVRARLDHRVVLGWAGLPHPAFAERIGFSFLLAPHRGATGLRLEARTATGEWTEFFRTPVVPAPAAPASPVARPLGPRFERLVIALLRRQRLQPGSSWREAADGLLAAAVAEPLNADPNEPLIGALEEPRATGRLRYGAIPVTGWLAHGPGRIRRLSACIDPLPPVDLPQGLVRPDVIAAFPALGGQARSAFAAEVPLPAEFAAPVLLKIFAELEDGEIHLAFAQRFTPEFHRGPGEMPPQVTLATYCRAAWALHQAAGRYRQSRHGLIRAAHSFWSRHQARPAYRPARSFSAAARAPAAAGPASIPAGAPAPAVIESPATTVIAAGDDMFVGDAAQYFRIGREALALVRSACALAGCARVEGVLDLPSGHGRVARWLRAAYPTAKLAVSDTQAPGVRFCMDQLGATGVPATVEGSHWAHLPGPYDIIWCGSLLTHFGLEQWVTHLRRFAERLAPRGVLVFTTHGLVALDKLQTGEKDYGLPGAAITRLCDEAVALGFGYVDYPETPGYGISISQPAWIREFVARETNLQVRTISESAWDQHQDVVVCTRR